MSTTQPQADAQTPTQDRLPFLLTALGYSISGVPGPAPEDSLGPLPSGAHVPSPCASTSTPLPPQTQGNSNPTTETRRRSGKELPELTTEECIIHLYGLLSSCKAFPWLVVTIAVNTLHHAGDIDDDELWEWQSLTEMHALVRSVHRAAQTGQEVELDRDPTPWLRQTEENSREILNDLLLWGLAVSAVCPVIELDGETLHAVTVGINYSRALFADTWLTCRLCIEVMMGFGKEELGLNYEGIEIIVFLT